MKELSYLQYSIFLLAITTMFFSICLIGINVLMLDGAKSGYDIYSKVVSFLFIGSVIVWVMNKNHNRCLTMLSKIKKLAEETMYLRKMLDDRGKR